MKETSSFIMEPKVDFCFKELLRDPLVRQGFIAAVLGVVLNAVSVERFKKVSMACYLAMGWVVVLAMGDFYRAASPLSFWCLLAGGILYTVGAALYGVGKKIPYIHPVFHLFVLAGSVLHTVSVWGILR